MFVQIFPVKNTIKFLPSLVRVRQPQANVHTITTTEQLLKKHSYAVLGCVLTGGASRRSTPRLWLPAPRSQLPTTQPIFGTVEKKKKTHATTTKCKNHRISDTSTKVHRKTENHTLHLGSPTPHLSGRLGVVRRTSFAIIFQSIRHSVGAWIQNLPV